MEHIDRLPRYYMNALADLTKLEGNISDEQYLEVYGLFMQTFFGDVHTSSRPNEQIDQKVKLYFYYVFILYV